MIGKSKHVPVNTALRHCIDDLPKSETKNQHLFNIKARLMKKIRIQIFAIMFVIPALVLGQGNMTIHNGAQVTVDGSLIINSPPAAPIPGVNVPSQTQIIWNWIQVGDATGYKFGLTNNINTAIDLGPQTTYTEANLTCGNSYTRYVWAYNANGVSSVVAISQAIICIFPCGQSLVDSRDNKAYNTVLIGSQCWMAQSLNYGVRINSAQEQTNNGIAEKYCYDNLESNCNVYGGLYHWDEAMQYSTTTGVQGICPPSWHLPSNLEWGTLKTFLGGESIAGGKMKETGTAHWLSPNTGATNSSGFTALGGGYSMWFPTDSWFSDIKINAYFVTGGLVYSTIIAYGCYYYTGELIGMDASNDYGFSVRCIKD
jgi:uncharacterized protein (TIGR02145 family)